MLSSGVWLRNFCSALSRAAQNWLVKQSEHVLQCKLQNARITCRCNRTGALRGYSCVRVGEVDPIGETESFCLELQPLAFQGAYWKGKYLRNRQIKIFVSRADQEVTRCVSMSTERVGLEAFHVEKGGYFIRARSRSGVVRIAD